MTETLTAAPPVLPGHPAAADPGLEERALAVAARAGEALQAVHAAAGGEAPYETRQSALLELVVSGVLALPGDDARRRAYTEFHRDWLIRWPVLQSGHALSRAHQMLDLLQTQADAMGAPGMEVLKGVLGGQVPAEAREGWERALREVAEYVGARADDPAYTRADPFCADPAFPVLFRLFHGTARQFGVKLLDEAFLHHLVLRGLGAPGGRAAFVLAPHLQALPEGSAEGQAKTTSFEEGYDWRVLIGRCGEEGRAWSEEYAAQERVIGKALYHGLKILREGGIDEGAALLAEVREFRDGIRESHPGVFHVLGRFYHGENAYYEYLIGNLAEAEREMDAAAASVRAAMELHPFLLPLAPLIVDIPLQKARIARRENDWPLMARRLAEMLEMEMEARPLCVLSDGREIGYGTLREFFAGMELEPGQRAAVDRLMSRDDRLREFRRLTTRLYALPGLVTPS